MKVAAIDRDLALKGYQRLCAESGKDIDKLCVDDVVKTFCDESSVDDVLIWISCVRWQSDYARMALGYHHEP